MDRRTQKFAAKLQMIPINTRSFFTFEAADLAFHIVIEVPVLRVQNLFAIYLTIYQKEGRFGSKFTLVTNIEMPSIILTGRVGYISATIANQSNSNRQHLRENFIPSRHLILPRGTGLRG